jgi:5'-3' exonuclease
MLSLITHEPHFFIIRESLNENIWKKCEHCGGNGHFKDECPKLLNPGVVENKNNSELIDSIEFSLIKVHIVREYLELEFKHVKLNFDCDEKIKFERFIDDFVFLCFFVGNDFIPHLPSLKIREGAIDALLYLYKKLLPSLDGFLTEGNGKINLERTEILLSKLSLVEDEIFKRQLFAKNRELQRNAQRLIEQGRLDKSHYRDEVVREYFELKTPAKEVELTNKEEIQLFDDVLDDIEKMINKQENETEQDKLKKLKLSQEANDNFQRVLKEVLKTNQNKKMDGYQDPVRLGEEGWKSRYYEEKFKVSHDDHEFLKLIRQSYIEGICWVFSYYYNGCVSWEWYYPFHYAPFASDLCNIKDLEINFKMGAPFEPVQQLLSVLPPYSSNALPKCLQILMHDPLSELADFYPETIKLDINGQAFAWMGVNLIPFIDENRIRKAVDNKRAGFTEEEKNRNRFGETLVFFDSKTHFISNHAVGDNYNQPGYYTYISTPNFRTFAGKVKCVDESSEIQNVIGSTIKSKIKGLKIKEVRSCTVLGMVYENPSAIAHNSYLRKGLNLPPKVVMEDNLDYYCKRNFRGEEAIETVRRCLGYNEEEIEKNVRNELFDNTYNNNRAIEYNPSDMELLRKKRYKQNEEEDNRDRDRDYNRNNDRYFNRDNNNYYNKNRNNHHWNNYNPKYQGNNYNPNYQGNNYNPNFNRNYNPNYYQNKSFKTGYNQYPNNQNNQNNSQNPQNFNQFNNPNIKANVQNFLLQNANSSTNTNNSNYTPPNPLNQKQQPGTNPNPNDAGRDPNEALNNLIMFYQNYVGNLNNSQNK